MTILLYLGIGLVVGAVSGALGIGGGILLVPALVWLCGLDLRTASGTTLAVLVVPVVLPAASRYYARGYIDIHAALWIAAAFGVGGYLGAVLNADEILPLYLLRIAFGMVMVYIGMRYLVTASSEAIEAAAALFAMVFAWVGYLALRTIGRKHAPRPDLGEKVRAAHEQGYGDPDYMI